MPRLDNAFSWNSEFITALFSTCSPVCNSGCFLHACVQVSYPPGKSYLRF